MTLACAIMALTISLQWRRIKQQEKLISDFNEKGFREVLGYGKVYRRRYIFVNIENAGDNCTLNSVAENYYDNKRNCKDSVIPPSSNDAVGGGRDNTTAC